MNLRTIARVGKLKMKLETNFGFQLHSNLPNWIISSELQTIFSKNGSFQLETLQP